MDVLPYQLAPEAYVSQMVSKGVSFAGFLAAWRAGEVVESPDYIVDVVIAWTKVLPSH